MDQLADGVFAIPVNGRWLVHAPLQRVSALVNGTALRELSRGAGSKDGRLGELERALAEPAEPPAERLGPVQPMFLGLVPSRACNLRCRYCAFGAGHNSGDRLDVGLAIQAVDWMASRARSLASGTLDVHFFGGEPLIATDFLDVVVHRVRAAAAAHGLTPHLEATTNGVFPEAVAQWIGDYFDAVVLSFDGVREDQDRQRPLANGAGTFEAVSRTARILGASPIELCLRICVTSSNVARLPGIVRWFCDEFRLDSIDFETLQPTELARQSGLEPPDPFEFAKAWWQAREIAEQHGVSAVYSAWSPDQVRSSFCPVGKDALILTPDGRLSACYLERNEWEQRGMDLTIGRVVAGTGVVLDEAAVQRARRLGPHSQRCRQCFCRWTCAGGCHVNHSFPGCPATLDAFCIQTRLISAACLLAEMGHAELAAGILHHPVDAAKLACSGEPLS